LRQYLASLPKPKPKTTTRSPQPAGDGPPALMPNLPTERCRPDGSNAPNCIFVIPTTTSPY